MSTGCKLLILQINSKLADISAILIPSNQQDKWLDHLSSNIPNTDISQPSEFSVPSIS